MSVLEVPDDILLVADDLLVGGEFLCFDGGLGGKAARGFEVGEALLGYIADLTAANSGHVSDPA